MARPRKNPEYNPDKLTRELLEAVSAAYLSPQAGCADRNGHALLSTLAEDFSMTPIKVRKLLVTAGVYKTPASKMVMELKEQGKTLKEIGQITGLSAASVSGYLPYQKTVYKLNELSATAERLKVYRSRKKAVEQLRNVMDEGEMDEIRECLWETMQLFEGYVFRTSKGLKYHYAIKGNEIFFSRKEKSVTQATVDLALETVFSLWNSGKTITGPKKLGCFGASYLYPVFIRLGVIRNEKADHALEINGGIYGNTGA